MEDQQYAQGDPRLTGAESDLELRGAISAHCILGWIGLRAEARRSRRCVASPDRRPGQHRHRTYNSSVDSAPGPGIDPGVWWRTGS